MKEQNWVAVSLDFIIVVFGVFIGLQVANWNKEREEFQQTLVIQERLKHDFNIIINDLKSNITRIESTLENAKLLASYLKTGDYADNPKPIADLVSPATHWVLPLGDSPTYEELVSTGKLDLIQPQSLRTALFEYNKGLQHYLSVNEKLHMLLWSNVDNLIEIEELGLETDALIPSLQKQLEKDLISPRTYLEAVFAVTAANSHLILTKRTLPKA